MEAILEEPKGIPFFSVKTGETHYCKLEPTISAYINSSDMGINASRGQNYGWRLGSEWVERVKAFKRDATQMSILTAKNQGQKPTTVQILYHLYGEELARFYEQKEDQASPYEEQYQQDISGKGARAEVEPTNSDAPQALADFQSSEEDVADLIDDVIAEDDKGDKPESPKQPETTGVDSAKPGADKSVESNPVVKDGKTAKQTKKAQ